MSVGILGAGAFGTALAVSLTTNGSVSLWTRTPEDADVMLATRENARRLPGVTLPETLSITSDLRVAVACNTVLLAIPMQQMRGVLEQWQTVLADKVLVACCKGIELQSGKGPLEVIAEVLPDATTALLTGPSFARDIAQGLPTALTLACASAPIGEDLQHQLSTGTLRLYRSTDTRGAELGGALKNVIAIACGVVIGAGLGDSARAALMTRGYAEMVRYATALGAKPETLAGLSGFGDLTLTCTSDQSRNYRLGLAIGRGERFDPQVTVEGAATARAVVRQAQERSLDMPVSQVAVALMDQKLTVKSAMGQLLARPLKEE